jgi:imidazolonepropionase-like amidohydrolase
MQSRFVALWLGGCVALGAAAQTAAVAPEHVALVGGHIIPVVGASIEKGTVLIEHGKISAVGEKVDVPYDARVFDVSGKYILPGMIDVHTARGLDIPNEPRPVTPQLDVADALDPSQLFFEDCLRLGITGVHVIPGNNTVMGGVGRVVRPIGLTVAEMTIAEGEFLKIAITPRVGFDRMVQMATLRETFLELDDYLAKLAEKRYEDKLKEEDKKIDVGPAEARKRGRELIRAEDVDDQHRNVLRLRGGRLPAEVGQSGTTTTAQSTHAVGRDALLFKPLGAFVYCGDAMDVGLATQLAKDNGFFERLVLVLGGECHKAVGELKQAARPVVLPGELTYRETNPLTGEVRETFVPKEIFDAGLLFALVPGGDDSYAERMLTYQAAQCVRYGVPRDEALKAITLNPAKMLGLEKRLGSIEPGKDADLVIFSGDPLEFSSLVEQVFIDGIPAYERAKDVRLQRLLSPGTSDSTSKPE